MCRCNLEFGNDFLPISRMRATTYGHQLIFTHRQISFIMQNSSVCISITFIYNSRMGFANIKPRHRLCNLKRI